MRRTRGMWAAVAILAAALMVTPVPGGADGNEAPGAPLAYRSISVGQQHTCAILTDGRVKCWGYNSQGELGLGDETDRGDDPGEMGDDLPAVDLGTGRTAIAVSAQETSGGGSFSARSCALLDNGTVKCWGTGSVLGIGSQDARGDDPGEMGDNLPAVDLGTGRTATAITAGVSHTCALLDNGQVKCWGQGSLGRLGYGDTASRGYGPGQMGDALPPVDLGTGRTAVSISAGIDHTCALLDNETVKCWGSSLRWGMLGYGDEEIRGDEPQEMGDDLPAVDLGAGAAVTAIAAGGHHTCALLDSGRVKCWGENNVGQLGYGDTFHRGNIPNTMGDHLPNVPLGSGRTAVAVAAGGRYSYATVTGSGASCAVLDDHTVKCWGTSYGQADDRHHGATPGTMGDQLPAIQLGTGTQVTGMTTGGSSSFCAWLTSAELKCWGDNTYGQLGLGDSAPRGGDPAEMGDALAAVDLGGGVAPEGVDGSVADAITGARLSEVWVALLRQSDFRLTASAVTDGLGDFSVDAPPGTYYLYLVDPTTDHATGFHGPPTPLEVHPGGRIHAAATMALLRGSLTGTVTETGTGTPIAGVRVITLDATTGTPQVGAVTNATGRYTINRLQPGDRLVAALDPTGAHASRFSPSASDASGAAHVPIDAGARSTADLTLPIQPTSAGPHVLSGQVTETGTGRKLTNVLVLALRAGDFALAGATVTNTSGGYQVAVAAGAYKVAFLDLGGLHAMEWHADQPYHSIGTAASVNAPATVDASLAATFGAVSGSVVKQFSGQPIEGAWVAAIGPAGLAGGTVTGPTGSFLLPILPIGTYRVTAVDSTGLHDQQFWSDSPDYGGASPLNVLGAATSEADFALTMP